MSNHSQNGNKIYVLHHYENTEDYVNFETQDTVSANNCKKNKTNLAYG